MPLFVREKGFYKTLLLLAIPIALQNLITFAVGFADNLMIGKLGEYAISGVYMGNQIQTFLQFFVMGADGAMLILSTQYWGKRDTESIKSIAAVSIRFCLVVSALITLAAVLFPSQLLFLFTPDQKVVEQGVAYLKIVCFSYLFFCVSQLLTSSMRAVETVRIGMYTSLCTLVVNVSLNYVFIFGHFGAPAMGVRGAALATLIARVFEAAVMLVYVLLGDKKLRFRPRDFLRRNRELLLDLCRYGLPVLGGQIVWAINTLAQSAIIGQMQAEAIASVSITGMLNSLSFIFVMGLTTAVGIVTGKTIGAGQTEKMRQYAKTVQALFICIGFLVGAGIFLMRDTFISFYTLGAGTKSIARQFMTVLSVTSIGRCYQASCLAGLVKAGGDTSFVFKNDTIFVFGVVLPSALIALYIFHAPAWVVYLCLQSDQVLKCIVAYFKINSFNWMKNLTRAA